MVEKIKPVLINARNLTEVESAMVDLFVTLKRADSVTDIGYVAGIITSDGSKHIEANILRLANYTERLRTAHDFPIFSATDVFSSELFKRLPEMALPHHEREIHFINFWRNILNSGHVSHIFMTPRWDKSKGAMDEHQTARQRGLKIYYVEQGREKSELVFTPGSILG